MNPMSDKSADKKPTEMVKQWIRWRTVKHHDGRRASAVGYNTSLWHLAAGDKTACGREIGIVFARRGEYCADGMTCFRCFSALSSKEGVRNGE